MLTKTTHTQSIRFKNILTVTLAAVVLLVAGASAQEVATSAEETAKTVALTDAGVTEEQVTWTNVATYRRRGVEIIDLGFLTDTHRYGYEINAETGAIVATYARERWDDDWLNRYIDQHDQGETVDLISMEDAFSIAFQQAGVEMDQVDSYDIELDEDDGFLLYEIEFTAGRMEYECEIDAITGDILHWEQDRD